MTWVISAVSANSTGITLPIPPETWGWSHTKNNLTQSTQSSFLSFLNAVPRSQEMRISGWIYPVSLAKQLQDLIKDPQDPEVGIETGNSEVQTMIDGKYIINRGSVNLDRPVFANGNLAYRYEVSFLQVPEQNEQTSGGQGTPTGDEPATGVDDMVGDTGLFDPINFSDFFIFPDLFNKLISGE